MTAAGLLRPWRSTPLRLTGILVLVFIASSLATFTTAYWVVRSTFDAALEDQLRQIVDSYRAMGTADELLERLRLEASATDPSTTILDYLPDRGGRISNVNSFPPVSGFAIVSGDAVGGEDLADSYLALSIRLSRGQLVVANTREQVVEMGEIFATVFLVGLLPTLAITAAAGLVVARGANRKIDAIRDALASLTMGKLEARVAPMEGSDDLAQIGDAVNRMAVAQEASIASLRQVTADIAHDLKTPIQRVAVLLERLSKDEGSKAQQDALIDQALAETDRIAKTFQALLQIAQIEGGAVQDRFSVLDLGEVATGIVELYAAAAEETGHALSLDVDPAERFDVEGDRHLLGQVIANLLENGLRHVPQGGRIDVRLSRTAKCILLSVADNGPGIPEYERDSVLRRLYRLERSRTSDGSGLGLSLVSAVCDLHGAALTLKDNAPGLIVDVAFSPTRRD
ncbi:HAMP domain-containing sensor histidine kinase [Palleronia rufa]